jgi:hypothetical protein
MLNSKLTHLSLSPVRLATIAALALAVCAAPASAAPAARYAAPNGSGTACTQKAPCNVHEAYEKAPSGADVYIRAGDYHLSKNLEDAGTVPIHVHGIGGTPRLIFASSFGLWSYNGETTLENLYVTSAGDAVNMVNGGTMDRVTGVSTGDNARACFGRYATVTNSTCWAAGTNAIAYEAYENQQEHLDVSEVRNVTAIASGAGGIAIQEVGGDGHSAIMNLTNVIARGGPGAADLETVTDGSPGSAATINTRNSNFETDAHIGSQAHDVTPDPSDQTDPPVFVDAAHGDLHQACGSPTIGAGQNDPANGPKDLDGDARSLGSVTDIGADEFVESPTTATAAPAAVKLTGATLRGAVNPNGCTTKYHFEYGTTAAYGHSTPEEVLPNGAAALAVSAPVAGLTKATRYHFRLVASSVSGIRSSADATFTTVDPFAGVAVVSRKAKARKRTVKIALSCPAGTPGSCDGTLKLKKGKARLGKAAFSIPAGQTMKVKVKLSKKARKLLKLHGKFKSRATVLAHDGLGTRARTSGKVKVRRVPQQA